MVTQGTSDRRAFHSASSRHINAGSHDTHYPTFTDETRDGGPVWQTWKNVVNVGEKGRALNGQSFIDYGGRWGQIGILNGSVNLGTSGPDTPSVQGSWNQDS